MGITLDFSLESMRAKHGVAFEGSAFGPGFVSSTNLNDVPVEDRRRYTVLFTDLEAGVTSYTGEIISPQQVVSLIHNAAALIGEYGHQPQVIDSLDVVIE